MRRLNRSFTILIGIVGTLVMAYKAAFKRAVREGSGNNSDGERQLDSNGPDNPEGLASGKPIRPLSSHLEVTSMRSPRRFSGAHFLFSPSADSFGFQTPLGTLSALRPVWHTSTK